MVRVSTGGLSWWPQFKFRLLGEVPARPPPESAGRYGHFPHSWRCPSGCSLRTGRALLRFLASSSLAAVLSLPPGRLGRVCRQPGARLLARRPVHQPRGLLHLPLPHGQGRQPRPSWPGLCRRVLPHPFPKRWAVPPPRGPGCAVRPTSPSGRMGVVLRAHHTVRNPQKCFHFIFFNQRN